LHTSFSTIDKREYQYNNSIRLLGLSLKYEKELMANSKILLLETDSALRSTRNRLLTNNGYVVNTASSFEEAVKTANQKTYDLLILNIENAVLLNMQLAQFPPASNILILAEKNISDELIESLAGKFYSYLFSPFTTVKFLSTVFQTLNQARMLKESIRNEVLTDLSELNHKLAIESGIEKFIETVVQIGVDRTSADYVSMVVNGNDTGKPESRSEAGQFDPAWGSIIRKLENVPEPVIINEDDCLDEILAEKMRKSNISSLIHVPLVAKGNTIGSLTHLKKLGNGKFITSDLSFTSILAWWTGMAIDNTNVYLDYFNEHLHADRLLDHISFAQENERKRVAVEIHDGVAQWLVGASYDIKLCNRMISDSNYTELELTIDKVKDVLQKSVKELRRAISNLPLPPLEELGLTGVIRKLAEKLDEEGIKCRVKLPREFPKLTLAQEKTFYWLIQESLTNIRKHSQASCVDIQIRNTDEKVSICITDNGIGFDVEKAMESKLSLEHIGLLGMKERAEYLNGLLNIDSEPGKGTSVNLSFSLLPREVVTIART
jgi:nitrate/nitrite-specific signal transduction histidine kinase/CheY-like chemotaxis protein